MKFLQSLLLVLVAQLATAQSVDYCKQITKEVSDDKTIFNYTSPYDPAEKNLVRVTRAYYSGPEDSYDNFYIIFQMLGELDQVYYKNTTGELIEREEKKLIVEFEDKTKLVDDTVKIAHDFSDDRTQATRYIYFPLTSNNLADFTTKRIAKFSLAGYELQVAPDSANAVMQYILCLNAVKK